MPIFAKTPVPSETEIQSMPTPKRVDRGIRLQRVMERAKNEFEKIKASLRGEADVRRQAEPELSPVHFVGGIGTAKVTYKGDSLKVKKEQEEKTLELKDKLPPEVFFRMFDVVTLACPVKDFKDRFNKLPKEQQAIVLQYFAWCPNSPAVEFSK